MNNESEVLGRIDNMKSLTTELAEQAGALKRITTHFRDNLEELDLLLAGEAAEEAETGFDAAHQIEIAYHFYEDLPQGSFATKLMSAWVQADPPNRRRIEIGFPYIGETMRYLANNKNTSLAKLKQILTKNQNLI